MSQPIRFFPLAVVIAIAGVLATAPPAEAQVSMDFSLDSADPFNGAMLSLGPGSYSLGVVSGGWNAWGYTRSCDGSGAGCSAGWLTTFHWALGDGDPEKAGRNGRWATQELALSNTPAPFFFSLVEESDLFLSIRDSNFNDNVGTLGLRVTSPTVVPEPTTLILLGTGLMGLAAVAPRRRNGDGTEG